MIYGLNLNDMKIVSDIYVHDGTSFVSIKGGNIKGGNIKVHNGTGFVALGTVNSPIYDGSDWCYVETAITPTFTTQQSIVLSATVMGETVPLLVNPTGTVSVISKPKDLHIFIEGTTNITYSFESYSSDWEGQVILRCSNGAPDVLVYVAKFEY